MLGSHNHSSHSSCFSKDENGQYYCTAKISLTLKDVEKYKIQLQNQKDAEVARDSQKIITDLGTELATVTPILEDLTK